MHKAASDYTSYAFNTYMYRRATYMGVPVQKLPNDLWVMQELLWEVKPDLLIETGTYAGGSALYYADLFQLWNTNGTVFSIDLEPVDTPYHPRVVYLPGHSSTSGRVFDQVLDYINYGGLAIKTIMVVLDSDHSRAHVRDELDLYASLVTPGSYLVVEDTCVNNLCEWEQGEGPMEALDDWLATKPPFDIDRRWEKYGATFHPRGFLRRRDA